MNSRTMCLLMLSGLICIGSGCAALVALEGPQGGQLTHVQGHGGGSMTAVTGPAGNAALIIAQAPPKAKVEKKGKQPTRHHVWTPGHWEWRGNKYHWRKGRWVRKPKNTSVWVAARWVHTGNGWKFIAGFWQ